MWIYLCGNIDGNVAGVHMNVTFSINPDMETPINESRDEIGFQIRNNTYYVHRIVWSEGNTAVSWWSTSTAISQLNAENMRYFYLIIG